MEHTLRERWMISEIGYEGMSPNVRVCSNDGESATWTDVMVEKGRDEIPVDYVSLKIGKRVNNGGYQGEEATER